MDLVLAAIGLAANIFQLINSENSLKYVNQLTQLKLDLQAEKAKGYDADDAKIESIEQQISVVLGAANDELMVFAAKNVTPATHTPQL